MDVARMDFVAPPGDSAASQRIIASMDNYRPPTLRTQIDSAATVSSETEPVPTLPNVARLKENVDTPILFAAIGRGIPHVVYPVATVISGMACVRTRKKSAALNTDIAETQRIIAPHVQRRRRNLPMAVPGYCEGLAGLKHTRMPARSDPPEGRKRPTASLVFSSKFHPTSLA
jgi:hypothetical protein